MPLPKPNIGENRDQFIQRCMNDSKTKSEFPDIKQRLAVCQSQIGN